MKGSERRIKWSNTEYKIFDAVNGKEELTYDCESCNKMISYHNARNTPQHLAKTGCFLSHLNLLKHIVENKLNKCIVLEDDALQVNQLPEDLPDTFCYLGGIIMNKKITSKEKIIVEHKEGINTLDEKYRMVTTLSYYIPRWEIAQDLYNKLMGLKRFRAIDIVYGNIIENPKYIYPAVYIEEPFESQIQNKRINKHANEFYVFA